jgi:hypothetical protein
LAGGNMQGSCEPPPDHIWSTYQPRPNIPQALTNWVPTLPEAAAPPLFARSVPLSEINWSTASAFSATRRFTSTMSR